MSGNENTRQSGPALEEKHPIASTNVKAELKDALKAEGEGGGDK